MAETTVERTIRNKGGTIILIAFAALLVAIVGLDFLKLFHEDTSRSIWIKIPDVLQLAGAFIALLWLALIAIVSSMTMSGPSFQKTCPYTVPFIFAVTIEIVNRANKAEGFTFWLWIVAGVIILAIVLMQMLAFSLDPHSNSIFTVFRPFKIEILTVIQLSTQAPSLKQSVRSSIV